MRILLVLALSTALTGHLLLIQGIIRYRLFRLNAEGRYTTSRKLDELIRAYAAARGFNGSVLVARGGEVLLDKGYGHSDSSVSAGAGGIYSSVKDLYRWHLGLQGGWTTDSLAGRLVVSHSDFVSGFSRDFERVPEDNTCVMVLSNKSGSASNARNIARSLLAVLYNRPYSLP